VSEERNHRPGGRLRAALLLLPLAAVFAVRAEAGGASTPSAATPSLAAPEIRQEKITLSEALRLTVDYSPDVLLARQEVDRRRGLLQEASGEFDNLFLFTPQFNRKKTVLTLSQLRPAITQRIFLSEASKDLSVVASDIAKGLTDDKGFPLPDCQGRQYYINGSAVCLDKVNPTDVQTFQLLIDAQAAAASIPQDSPSNRLYRALLEAQRQRLTNILKLIRQVFIPALDNQLAAIGGLPSLLNYDTLDLDLRFSIPTRSGLVVAPVLYFEGIHDNYADKSESPALGGKGVPTLYRSVVGFTLDLPLLKGAGTTSVAAQENSARESYKASLQSLAHAAAQSVLRTTLAYWNLAAAQEELALLERSAASQKKIDDVASALVRADEVPKVELSRIAARTADLEGGVAAARRDVAQKRVDLARTIGLAVPDLSYAPLAADPLPSGDELREMDAATLARLQDTALERRADVKAAALRLTSADYLVKGTRVDLKPELNLSLQAGYNGIYEDPYFNVMSVFDPTGYWRSFQSPYVGPSFQLTLTFAFPFQNNTAKGHYAQADSLLGNASISKVNLQRTVRANVVQLADALVTAAAEVRSREAAVASNQEIVASTFERFRGGETTVLETLTTEQARTQAEADLVAARLMYATRDSRLRFETGSLLSYTIADDRVKFGEIAPTGPLLTPGP
jgi:outer membrane protein